MTRGRCADNEREQERRRAISVSWDRPGERERRSRVISERITDRWIGATPVDEQEATVGRSTRGSIEK